MTSDKEIIVIDILAAHGMCHSERRCHSIPACGVVAEKYRSQCESSKGTEAVDLSGHQKAGSSTAGS